MGEGKDLQVQLGLGLSLLPEKERSSASCLILSPWWVLLQQVSLPVCAGHNLQLLLEEGAVAGSRLQLLLLLLLTACWEWLLLGSRCC